METSNYRRESLEELRLQERVLKEVSINYGEYAVNYALAKIQDKIRFLQPEWMMVRIAAVRFTENGNIDTRIHNAALRLGLVTLGDLASTNMLSLLRCSNVGHKAVCTVEEFFRERHRYDWAHQRPMD